MSQPLQARRAPSLTTAILGFVVLSAILAAAAGWYLLTVRMTEFRQGALAEAVTVRARALELDFARTLHQEWRNARTIADDISRRDQNAIRSSLDLVVGDNVSVSWAGIAALNGTVTVASDALLEGQDVSQRPWFQRGLEGDFAGDVHEAKLLAKLLPTQDGEPRQFLDLATPVRDEGGAVSGVLGVHLNYAWALDHLRESAASLGIDAFLINREGAVVIATDPAVSGNLDLPSARAAMAGVSFTGIEAWPDGAAYFTTVVPQVGYQDLPSFGWSLIARIDDGAITGRPTLATLLTIPIGFGLVLMLMTFLFIQIFTRPIGKLAESAAAVMRDEDVYPYESRTPAEAQTLSAAIARLQGRSAR